MPPLIEILGWAYKLLMAALTVVSILKGAIEAANGYKKLRQKKPLPPWFKPKKRSRR